jgi:16S rRNA (cytidine1402-2'-O)-methyltransferase
MNLIPGLYIIPTPIGNIEDITLRALKILRSSDVICTEDTRICTKLLEKHSIKVPKLQIYNDHSSDSARQKIKEYIENGKIVSLTSDAGTPMISDPGYKLIKDLIESGIYIESLPGPCAAITALSISGLPTDKFYFAGFMPRTMQSRQSNLEALANLDATLIFYDAPTRILDSLTAVYKTLGDREICVARELTKTFQTISRGKISDIIGANLIKQKGEFVLLISGKKPELSLSEDNITNEIKLMKSSGLSGKDIAELLTKKYGKGISKSKIYKILQE